ncbi:MAG: hypothetical protein FWE37_06090 [Spirochaetaceae bacterium]|nr:hypothetical protein [Spirochaetaceae bacterium]
MKKLKVSLFMSIIIAVAALLIIIGVAGFIHDRQRYEVALKLDEIQILYESRSDNNLLWQLLNELTGARGYAGQRALFYAAMLSFDNGDYNAAISYFEQLRNRHRRSYLAATATLNQAYLSEQLGQTAEALALFELATANRTLFSAWPEAALNAARLNEAVNMMAAISYYRMLVSELEEGNSWKTLAENRLIVLEP